MSRAPALPASPDRPAPARAMIEAQMVALTRLAEIGMGIAEDAGRRSAALVQGDAAQAGDTDPGLTYSRAARAVRLTFALQSRLLEALAALDQADETARTNAAHRRRERIHRQVKQAIEAECDDRGEIKSLSWAAWERLTDDDDGDFADLPIAEAVARICADLGLPSDWGETAFGEEEGAEILPRPPAFGVPCSAPPPRPHEGAGISSAGSG